MFPGTNGSLLVNKEIRGPPVPKRANFDVFAYMVAELYFASEYRLFPLVDLFKNHAKFPKSSV